MPAYRFFHSERFEPAVFVKLEGEEAHHLARVMRCREGEKVELVNGKGELAKAEVATLGKRSVLLSVDTVEKGPAERRIILAQAIPRLSRLKIILEKATELGVTDYWLFPGELSEKKEVSKGQIEKLQTITISALKQSGRLYLPSIALKPPLERWEKLPCDAFFGDVKADAPRLSEQRPSDDSPVLIFIGPESGFTEKEEKKLQVLGAKGVKLHHNILRSDTAPLVALSLLY